MADKINDPLLQAFQEDLHEILNSWERVSVRAGALSSQEVYETLKRCAHNIKGNAPFA